MPRIERIMYKIMLFSGNENNFEKQESTLNFNHPYDYDSVMHYNK